MLFRVILSERGKAIYKGGNVEVMKPLLICFEAKDLRYAEGFFLKKLTETLGSASENLFKIEKIVGGKRK